MKNKTLLTASLALMMALPMQAQHFEDNFEDKTLRLDYIVAGDSVNQAIYFEQAYRDIKNSIDTAKEEGREEGRKEGREEGVAKEKLATAKRLLGMGLTQEQVAKGTGLSIEDIERLV